MKKHFKTTISSLIMGGAMLTAGAPLQAGNMANAPDNRLPEIYGCVIYADGWTQQENAVGMYSIPTSADMDFTSIREGHVSAESGGVLAGDTYWACYFVDYVGTPFVFVSGYDAETWKETFFDYGDPSVISTGVVYDQTTKTIYGCFRNDNNNGYVFGTVDYRALKRTKICDLPRMWSAVGITRTGQIYAIDELGDLYKVEKSNGAMTLVGNTGLIATHPSSACIDPRSGRFFYALTNNTNGSLYEVDLTTASSSLVYHFPKNQEVVGMFIRMPEAEDGAPDMVEDLSIDFTGGSLSGKVSFKSPSKTFGGTNGTGTLNYVIEANGSVAAHGTCSWGTKVEAPLSMKNAGEYKFRVYTSNSIGNGPAIEKDMYVGPDTPVAPEVTVSRTGDDVTLSWDAVTETVHGGYADFAGMRYKVVRTPDMKVVANNTTGLTATDRLPSDGDLSSYSYSVTAGYGNVTSEATVTEKLWSGSVTPPYQAVFDNEEVTEPFTVVNANGDAQTWTWDESQLAFKTTFNRSSDTDDWLITPPLNLKKGNIYKFTARMRTYNGNPETAEIKWGDSPEPSGLTMTVVPSTRIKTREAQEFTGYLTPENDGIYYAGIHCTTPASESWYLFVDALTIEAPVSNEVPAQPENLKAEADYDGKLSVALSFNAPSLSASGNTLTSIDRIELLRDGVRVELFSNPAPGSPQKYTDTPTSSGYHTYEVVPYNSYGEGKRAEIRVFVGVPSPGKPKWANVEETSVKGQVKITWAPVTETSDGNPLNPALVRYDIMTVDDTHGGEAYNVAEGITGDSYTVMAPGADKTQQFVYYAIKAVTDTDFSLMTLTPFLPVGPAYEIPYAESFAYGNAKSLMRPEDGDGMWSLYTDDSGIPANDGDKGMAAMFGELNGASATLYTGKVALGKASNPMLTLYAYNITGEDKDLNELHISVGTGTDFKVVRSVVMSDLGDADGWYPVMIPLSDYKGKEVQFALRGVTRNRKFTLVDNITVTDANKADLKAGLITAPASVEPGVEFAVEAGIENIGLTDISDYSVTLLLNGKERSTIKGSIVKPGETLVVRFPQTLNVAMDDVNTYQARVDYSGDGNPDNNLTGIAQVKINFPLLPVPREVSGAATPSGVTLEWKAPDLASAAPDAVKEDFENWDAWSKTGANGWTFLDEDQTGIGAIQNVVLPGIDYNSKLAWFVFDSSYKGLGTEYAAYSGNKYLSTFFCLPPGDFTYIPNNDWAISPKLYGGEQTISLMARSINPAEAEETFEVLYATEDTTDPAKFKSLTNVTQVPGSWTRYEFKLPQGALKFAIRYNKTYGLMLHIDDVCYVPAGVAELHLEGYNVYRDGELMTPTPLKSLSYSDSKVSYEDMFYGVSAVYSGNRESRICTPLVLNTSVAQTEVGTDVIIRASGDGVLISGANGMTCDVFDTTGRLVRHLLCGDNEHISLEKGIYLVKTGTVSEKVIVK